MVLTWSPGRRWKNSSDALEGDQKPKSENILRMGKFVKVFQLHWELDQAGIPIDGVSGPPWRIDFRPEATPAQRQQADTILAQMLSSSETEWDQRAKRRQANEALAGQGAEQMMRGILRAVYQSLAEIRGKLGLPVRSWAKMIEAISADIDTGGAD